VLVFLLQGHLFFYLIVTQVDIKGVYHYRLSFVIKNSLRRNCFGCFFHKIWWKWRPL